MSLIENSIFVNANHQTISADFDGQTLTIPVQPGNRHYDEIVEQSIVVAPYVAPTPVTDDQAYDALMAENIRLTKIVRSLIIAINDGSFVPGGNISNAALKAKFKSGLGV